MATTVDSYSESNRSTDFFLGNSTANAGRGQSFTGDGNTLFEAVFYLSKTGSPPFNIRAAIYAHSGVFGTSSVGTGLALAVSNEIAATTLSTSLALNTFTFSDINNIELVNGTNYVVMCEYVGTVGDNPNRVNVGTDNTSPTHGGNKVSYNAATLSWTAQSGEDTCFYIYGGILSLTSSRLLTLGVG